MGARGDSYYEYLLKQWLQTGKIFDDFKDDYIESVAGVIYVDDKKTFKDTSKTISYILQIEKHLVKKTSPNNLLFVGELISGKNFKPKMDELVSYQELSDNLHLFF